MYIAAHVLVGLVTLHAMAIYWYLTGTLVRSAREAANDALALADVVITVAAGMALFGFGVFVIGICGLLDGRGFALVIIVELLAGGMLTRRSRLSATVFWAARLAQLRRAASAPAIAVYVALLILALPAALPAGAFDVMQYYLPYPLEWANAGRIYVDETLPSAYYANNFLLFYAAYFRLGLGAYTNFIPWFCGALSALGIFAIVRAFALSRVGAASHWLSAGVPLAVTALFALEPSFLRWVNTGMLDVPLGFFLFVPVMATALMLLTQTADYRAELVLTAAFLAGMKPPMLAYLPLFTVFLIVAWPPAGSKRGLVVAVSLLVILSAPWYAMNVMLDGDPVPPVLHLMLHRPDPLFTGADAEQMRSVLHTSTAPAELLLLPVRFFSDAIGSNFVEYGASIGVTYMYLPYIALGYVVLKRRASGIPAGTLLVTAAFIYGFAYWVTTSHHARFFLEIMPIYFAAIGLLALWLVQGRNVALQVAVVAILTAGLVPSPSAWGFLNYTFSVDYAGINAYIPDRAFFDDNWCDGCREVEYVAARIPAHQQAFTLDLMNLTFLLRERGIINLGSKYSNVTDRDLFEAVESRDLPQFVRRYSIGAFLINTASNWPDNARALFEQQIKALGFAEYEYPHPRKDGHVTIFMAPAAIRAQ